MNHPKFIIMMLLFITFTQLQSVNACLNFNQKTKRCIVCPVGTHLYKANCIYDINNCLDYHQGVDCKKCQPDYKLIKNLDRIQCTKLQSTSNDQYFQEQINPQLQINAQDPKQQFYSFLNDYFTQKYRQNNLKCNLVKILDRVYENGQHDVILFYKTPNSLQKTVSAVIGQYKTFQLKQIKPAQSSQIQNDQVFIFQDDHNDDKTVESVQKVELEKPIQKNKQTNQKSSQNGDEIKESSDFNFQYQKPQIRQKDIGFQTSDQFLKLSNNKILDDGAKVVGCFVKSSGLRKHYRLFYKCSSQQIYQGEVIYDIVRRRAYILNFGKQFTV